MRKWAKIASLLFLGLASISWKNIPMTASDAKIRLSGFEAEGHELWHDASKEGDYYTEYRWWGFRDGDYIVQAAFLYAGESGGYWARNATRKSGFVGHFAHLHDVRRSEVTRGPTVETALGSIKTLMFDVSERTYGEQTRQCIGFRTFWDPNHDGYVKMLDFYACGKDGRLMTGEQFVEILRGLRIEGEFDALIAD